MKTILGSTWKTTSHHGLPQRNLAARWYRQLARQGSNPRSLSASRPRQAACWLCWLIPTLLPVRASSACTITKSRGHPAQTPGWQGWNAPADAAVLRPAGTMGIHALVIAAGMNPEYGNRTRTRWRSMQIDEAIRNAAASGADPERMALLDNFAGVTRCDRKPSATCEVACGQA